VDPGFLAAALGHGSDADVLGDGLSGLKAVAAFTRSLPLVRRIDGGL
jgi:hypothetical protein